MGLGCIGAFSLGNASIWGGSSSPGPEVEAHCTVILRVPVIFRFDSFELDRSQYRLSREQTNVPTKPMVLELLAYLIEHRDRVVTREELFSELWKGRFVSDGVLTLTVHEARHALGEDAAKATFIKTLHGRGYQFIFRPVQVVAPVNADPATGKPSAFLLWAGFPTPLRDGENFIGRDPDSVIVLAGLRVSRQHARVVLSAREATVEDLGSKNGTLVNGVKISAATPLSDGDEIEIGGVVLTFRRRLSDPSTLTAVDGARGTGAP
jgi:DNA-binding winged helix-turn-helix (wHTH) protein